MRLFQRPLLQQLVPLLLCRVLCSSMLPFASQILVRCALGGAYHVLAVRAMRGRCCAVVKAHSTASTHCLACACVNIGSDVSSVAMVATCDSTNMIQRMRTPISWSYSCCASQRFATRCGANRILRSQRSQSMPTRTPADTATPIMPSVPVRLKSIVRARRGSISQSSIGFPCCAALNLRSCNTDCDLDVCHVQACVQLVAVSVVAVLRWLAACSALHWQAALTCWHCWLWQAYAADVWSVCLSLRTHT